MIAALAFMVGLSLAAARACPADPPILPKVVQQTGHAGAPLAVAWIGEGRIVTLGEDGRLIFRDAANGRAIDNIAVPLPPPPPDVGAAIWQYRQARLMISPDRRYAAVSVETTNSNWETLAPNTVIIDLQRHTARAPMAWRPLAWLAGPRLVVGDGTALALVDPAADGSPGALTALPTGFGDGARVAASADGARFASVVEGTNGAASLGVWRTADLAELGRYPLAKAAIEEIGFNQVGRRVFVRDTAGALSIFGVDDGARSVRSLAAALAAPGRERAVREFQTTDIDAHAVVVGDWMPNPNPAGDAACDCETRVVDYETGAVRGRAPGEAVGVTVDVDGRAAGNADHSGGVIVIDRRRFGGGDEGPLLGDAVRMDLATGALTRLGGMVEPPLALSPRGERIAATTALDPATGALASPARYAFGGLSAVFVEAVAAPEHRIALSGFHAQVAADSAASPDGQAIAFLFRAADGQVRSGQTRGAQQGGAGSGTEIRLWTPASRTFATVARVAGDFQSLRWLSSDRLVLHALDDARSMLVDLPTGAARALPIGLAAPVDGPGRMVGWTEAAAGEPGGLVIVDARTGQIVARPAPLPPWADPPADTGAPRDIAVSPDGTLFAAAFAAHRSGCDMCAGDTWGRIGLWDAGGRLIGELRGRPATANGAGDQSGETGPGRNFDIPDGLSFSADGRRLLALIGGAVRIWDLRQGVQSGETPAATWTGLELPVSLTAALPDRHGRLGRQAVRWVEAPDGSLAFLRGAGLFSLFLLPDDHWLVTTPDGRYDTDLAADTPDIRWLVPDEPDRSLAPQTFMRDYFEPDLAARILICTAAGNCAAAFPARPDMACLDRVLPEVTRITVRPGPGPGLARVDITVAEGVRPDAANGKTRSGVHDLRLFRDGKLVDQWPRPPAAKSGAPSLAAWRAASAAPGLAGGTATHTFVAALPSSGSAAGSVSFSAYAFNADRVKGETVVAAPWVLPAQARPGLRRAYVIAIGVDAYPRAPGHALNFAAADARTMTAAFSAFRGYQVTSVALTAEAGKASQADKADIRAVLDILAGRDPGAARAVLAGARIDASGLAKATPDDLVIVSFSGHGWADATGDFFLLPADAVMAQNAFGPEAASLISSADLTDWLRGVDAGEMALIIDACHSAASVQAQGFKPGPMGDPGLGQLAYDKGIRILAATQGDAVALESAALHGGLLTFALTHDGLGLGTGKPAAPTDWSGAVPLDKLMQYALADVPRIEKRDASGHHAGLLPRAAKPLLVPRDPAPPAPPIQLPALFDFNGPHSRVAVLPPIAASRTEAAR